jgi:alpha-glucosidase
MTSGTKPPLSTGWGFPALFENNGIWALISETGLDESFCGSHLSANCEDGVYRIEYPFEWENYGLWDALPQSNLPWETPWRIIIIGNHPGRIAESNLSFHLADPCKLEDTTWIQPGTSSWNWWSDHSGGWKFESLKDYIDFSAEMGWKYSLVDAEWHRMQGGTLEELARYAKEKNIGLNIWYNSGGEHSRVMDAGPRNLMDKSEIRQKEMQRIANLGIKGIKVDFFQGDKQKTIQLYLSIIKDAAAQNLLVNTHGSTIPRGWDRTWPNLISMEAVRGGELYSYPPYTKRAVWQNTILPFTRNTIGSMDFTPVTFSDYSPETKHITTNAHELALSVIFESGIQHFADRAESYRDQPEYVIDFLKKVPVTWDDTYLIDGYPGEFVVMCREKNGRYYIAGINGTMESKNISFKIPGLNDNQTYELQLIKDGDDSRSFAFSTLETNKEKKHTVEMLPAGGFAGIIKKKDK